MDINKIIIKDEKESYLHRVLVALDVFCNVILGGLPNETISSRVARNAARGSGFSKFILSILDKISKDHGIKAEEADLGRADIVQRVEEKALDKKGT